MKILIIEDNKNLRDNLIFLLKKKSFLAEWASNWEEALTMISKTNYDILILDINMPIINWKEFIKIFRQKNNNTPIIALTSNWLLEDKLELFDLGVDDYLTKPFEIEELVARINSILKRRDKLVENIAKYKDIKIDFNSKKIYKWDKALELALKQYLIVEFLFKNIWIAQSKVKIMEYVWWELEENLEFNSTTLESHIYSIRKKVSKDFIKTIVWFWYVIE